MSTYVGQTLEGRQVALSVEGGRIASISDARGDARVDDPPLIAPPLVDLQHNGSLGHRYNMLANEPDGLRRVAGHLRRHGVGKALFTTTTCAFDLLLKTLAEFDRQLCADAELAELYVGHFHEGMYISGQPGWGGAHDLSHIRNPSWDEWRRIIDASGGRTRIFNVDPSMPGAIETIAKATKAGVLVSLGHANPAADQVKAAADAGASLVTHFGNGVPAQIHRHNNPLWSYLADERLRLGLIADGHHLPADILRTAFATKGTNRAYIVSDASPYAGLEPGAYDRALITGDGAVRLKDNAELLAGAWFQLDRGVERLCQLGWSRPDAWRQATEIPASILSLQTRALAPGQPASFVVARFRNGGLILEQVLHNGTELLKEPITPLNV